MKRWKCTHQMKNVKNVKSNHYHCTDCGGIILVNSEKN